MVVQILRVSLLLALLPLILCVSLTSVWPQPQIMEVGTTPVSLVQPRCILSSSNNGGGSVETFILSACDRYKSLFSKPAYILQDDQFPTAANTTSNLPRLLYSSSIPYISDILFTVASNSLILGLNTSEYYSLTITTKGVEISSDTVFGALRAMETLSQLLYYHPGTQQVVLPCAPYRISDAPRFAHRGLLLDTARSFYSVSSILKLLDTMSWTKLNVFHWHIVDSQSFPLQSDVLPDLAKKGAYNEASVYTKEDVQRIIDFAFERGIRVILEIDTPGHTYIWSKAYPDLVACANKQTNWWTVAAEPPSGQLNPTKMQSLQLVKSLITEQTSRFPDVFFHIGADEVNAACYSTDPDISKYLTTYSLKVEDIIKSFINEVINHVSSLNKRAVMWEEAVLEYNVEPKNSIIQVWKGAANMKKVIEEKKLPAIASPYEFYYLDCGQGEFIDVETGGASW